MKKQCLLFLFFLSTITFSQDLSDFQGLKAQGNLPIDFTTLSQDKYQQDRDTNTDKSLDKDFFLNTRFIIDELLLSGQILFNDPLSNYLNDVARYTLTSQRGLYKELRFYVLKSNIVNAFSTDQGIIVFTTGLLGQLENEAQLAYIIAHEVSHYTEKHVRESYVERKKVSDGSGKYQRLTYDSRITEMSIYEKKNELEADEKGIEIYLTTEYAVDDIFSSFEMLLYSYLPFEEVKFDTTFLATDKLVIPGIFFPDTINEITREENYDDENSTHPNIQKRMDAAFDLVDGKTSKGDFKFKVSEERFYEMRELARFEGINLYLTNRNYARALYNVFLLKRKHTENRFLDLSLVKSLYGLTKYKNANRYREVVERAKEVEGESFTLQLFLNEISGAQLNVIAVRHAYDMVKKYPGDKIFLNYLDDLKKELAVNARFNFVDLVDHAYGDQLELPLELANDFDIEDSIAKIEASDLTKYQKIKRKKELRETATPDNKTYDFDEDFHLFALYDMVKNDNLIGELKEIKENHEEDQNRNYADLSRSSNGKSPEIKKVLVVDPVFEAYETNRKKDHKDSEDRKISLGESYSKPYKNLDIEVSLLDSKKLTKTDAEKYNDLGQLYLWVREVLDHKDLDMISSMHDRTEELKATYGTEHFLFSGVYAYRYRHEFSDKHLYAAIYLVTLPVIAYDLLRVHNYFELLAFSANLETDKIEFVQVNEVGIKSSNLVIEAYIYDILYELSKTNKK